MNYRNWTKSFTCTAVMALVLAFFHSATFAETEYVAKTAKNVKVSIDDLSSMLLPLTKSELEVEADAWQNALSSKVSQVSKLEIRNRDAAQKAALSSQAAGESASANAQSGGASSDTQPVAEDTELKAKIVAMRLDQSAIGKRYGLVLDALERKGGDVKDQRLYLDAVSAIAPHIDDTSAALLALKEWLKSDDGGVLFFINILKFAAAIVLVVLIARLLGRFTDRMIGKQQVSMLLESFIKVAVRRAVLVIGFIACLPIIGINIGPVLALIGAAGLVIGLALQGTLSNFASGLLILIYRPFDMGDAITVSGVSGSVNGMNLLSTTIKTFDNQMITIPNNNVWNGAITNITGSDTRRVDMVFGIGYEDDFGKAQEILHTILSQHPKVLQTPEPKIRLHELADSSVNLICRPWAKTADYWDVYWDVMETVKREFDKQGVSIPFPQRDVHFYPVAGATDQADKTA
ncbi:Small-conductance mechanosensitive channel [Halioglobus japonicus]|nr:Small-conductance mechanosensitive channel [Halioglobus japonicus]